MANEDEKTEQLPVVEAPASEPPPAVPADEAIRPSADVHCPNCNGPGIRKGKLILCDYCDASFRYTKEGPKVEELGPFDKLEARVTKLEGETNEGIGKRIDEITKSREAAEPDEPQPPEPAKPKWPEPRDDDGI